jgi:hypothetical protein
MVGALLALAAQLALGYALVAGGCYGWHRALHSPRAGALHRWHIEGHHRAPRGFPPGRPRPSLHAERSELPREGPVRCAQLALLAAWIAAWAARAPALLPFAAAAAAAVVWTEFVHRAAHLQVGPDTDPLTRALVCTKWFARARELHDVHHARFRVNYGFVSFWPDRLAGTFREPLPARQLKAPLA